MPLVLAAKRIAPAVPSGWDSIANVTATPPMRLSGYASTKGSGR